MQAFIMISGIAIIGLLYWYGQRLRIMPVPTLPAARRKALAMMPRDAKLVVELGAGWGGMTRRIRKALPNATVIAYERSLIPWAVSRVSGPVHRGDLFAADLTNADVVFCYLSPWHMARLAPKFAAELKNGASVISVAFPLPDFAPDAADDPVYLYRYRK
jgi:hypothetical protein